MKTSDHSIIRVKGFRYKLLGATAAGRGASSPSIAHLRRDSLMEDAMARAFIASIDPKATDSAAEAGRKSSFAVSRNGYANSAAAFPAMRTNQYAYASA